jgi:hypothetical protein
MLHDAGHNRAEPQAGVHLVRRSLNLCRLHLLQLMVM